MERAEKDRPPLDGRILNKIANDAVAAAIANAGGGGHPPGMEQRVAKLETDVGEIKRLLSDQLMPMLVRIDERLNGAMSQMATKADLATARGEVLEKLADKPGKGYLWTVLAVLVGAILAAVAAGVSLK